jgi:hypothetical protein
VSDAGLLLLERDFESGCLASFILKNGS